MSIKGAYFTLCKSRRRITQNTGLMFQHRFVCLNHADLPSEILIRQLNSFLTSTIIVSPATAYEVWLAKLRGETRRSRELFVTHFKDQYFEYPDLPIWMVCEVASFGSVSRLYDNMLKSEMKGVAQRYGLQPTFLASFLHAFVYLRNVCAHHSRLWDKSLSIKPQLPPGKLWDPIRKSPANSLFTAASAIYWMLGHDSVASASRKLWRETLVKVMTGFSKRFPELVRFTGFPSDWQSLALWK